MDAALDLSLRLAGAAHGRDDPRAAAQDVLAELCAGERVDAAALSCYDPVTDSHRTLCSTGYPGAVLDFLGSPAFLAEDVGYRLLVTEPGTAARCWRDTRIDYATTRSATQVFRPAGYAGGATARLTTRHGRYTGDLHVSTSDAALPSRTLMLALNRAAPLLATAVDTTRRFRLDLAELPPGTHAALVTPTGSVVALAQHAVSTELARRVRSWRCAAQPGRQASYRHLDPPNWWRLRLLALDRGTLVLAEPNHPAHAHRPDGPLSGRELEVLTLLTDGLANIAIGRRLGISERTVAHHVEHILGKLGATSRTAATRLAVERGLRLLP